MKKKLGLVLATLVVSVGLFGAVEASAKEVQKGDTLWDIANEHGTTVSALQNANGISGHLIYPGQNLVVPNGTGQATQPVQKQESQVSYQKKEVPVKSTPQVSKKEQAPQQSSSDVAGQKLTVSATAYTADCVGCSGITATGIDVRNSTPALIAVDPNVIPLGSKVYVPGYGIALAGDTGGAIKGNKIDLLVSSNSEAINWGRRTITVTVLD